MTDTELAAEAIRGAARLLFHKVGMQAHWEIDNLAAQIERGQVTLAELLDTQRIQEEAGK